MNVIFLPHRTFYVLDIRLGNIRFIDAWLGGVDHSYCSYMPGTSCSWPPFRLLGVYARVYGYDCIYLLIVYVNYREREREREKEKEKEKEKGRESIYIHICSSL